jgi:hypothetical protein
MTEAPKLSMGLLDGIGKIHELMASEGCNWETARQLLEAQEREEQQESNVVSLDEFRNRKIQ